GGLNFPTSLHPYFLHIFWISSSVVPFSTCRPKESVLYPARALGGFGGKPSRTEYTMSRRLVPSTVPPTGATCFAPAFLRSGSTSLPRRKISFVAAVLFPPSPELKSLINISMDIF